MLVFRVGSFMRRVVLSAAVIASLAMGASAPSEARDGWSPGAAVAFGLIGGLALGSVFAGGHHEDGYDYRYVRHDYPPREPYWRHEHWREWRPPVNDCYETRERIWVPGWGWNVRRRTVCD